MWLQTSVRQCWVSCPVVIDFYQSQSNGLWTQPSAHSPIRWEKKRLKSIFFVVVYLLRKNLKRTEILPALDCWWLGKSLSTRPFSCPSLPKNSEDFLFYSYFFRKLFRKTRRIQTPPRPSLYNKEKVENDSFRLCDILSLCVAGWNDDILSF